MMRTTINLPDDIYAVAREIAHNQHISLGEAIALLARKGLRPQPILDPSKLLDTSKPFPCFVRRPGSPPITLETTLAVEDMEV
jgi:hypothetical protein